MTATIRIPAAPVAFAGVLLVAALLRGLFPVADPPWRTAVGIVWHDEGAWVHNARNRVLFGEWRLDNWNPMFISPVFAGLEFLSFSAFGVGTWQARLVSEAAGVLSVLLLGLGLRRVAGWTAALVGAGLLATGFFLVMFNRAALMESTMIAGLVASWYCTARAEREPAWGLGAGIFAVVAYFAKATAVFYLGVVGLVAVSACVDVWRRERRLGAVAEDASGRAALAALAGLAVGLAVALVTFVGPHWSEYRFYNWQMSVTRRPSYSLRAFADRVTWFPVIHDIFTRMWFATVVGAVGALGLAARWRREGAATRTLVLWLALGTVELVARDVGNERYLVYLIPAFIAVTAVVLGRDGRLLPESVATLSRRARVVAMPVVFFAAYVLVAPLVRLAFLQEIRPVVRVSGALAVLVVAGAYASWPRLPAWLAATRVAAPAALALAGLVIAGDLVQYTQWATGRTYANYEASVELGRRLPPGSLVHGKLANGLALENRIRPVFVGRGFGNYDDRLTRDDIRYLLTYTAPRLGYEGSVILDVLAAYPEHRVLWAFDVRESRGGHDRAALMEKGPRR